MFLTLKLCTQAKLNCELFKIELTICIKMDLTLNNLQRLICHKTQPTNQQTVNTWRVINFTICVWRKKFNIFYYNN